MKDEQLAAGKAGVGGRPKSGSRASWIAGWVIGPGLIVLGILTAGLYVGANHPDSWITRLVNWVVALF